MGCLSTSINLLIILSVSRPEASPPTEMPISYSRRKGSKRERRETITRCLALHLSIFSSFCKLPQQSQHTLRQLVRLRQHRRTGLLEDLALGHFRGLLCK